jgi:uncharacterized membrane protein YkoI
MNTVTIARWTVVAVGFVVVVGGVGVALGGFGTDASVSPPQTAADDEAVEAQNESEENESVIESNKTIEAMRTAENQTNGTVIGAQLSGQGAGGLERSTFVYEFDVLADNGTRLVAEVYAENATVIGVKATNESDGFLNDIFGSDEGATDGESAEEARNASSLLSAAEAVELAANETEAERRNQTATEVRLSPMNESLVYNVTMIEPGGESRVVIVSAENKSEGVITTES